jgi:hypothetical protein
MLMSALVFSILSELALFSVRTYSQYTIGLLFQNFNLQSGPTEEIFSSGCWKRAWRMKTGFVPFHLNILSMVFLSSPRAFSLHSDVLNRELNLISSKANN